MLTGSCACHVLTSATLSTGWQASPLRNRGFRPLSRQRLWQPTDLARLFHEIFIPPFKTHKIHLLVERKFSRAGVERVFDRIVAKQVGSEGHLIWATRWQTVDPSKTDCETPSPLARD